MTLSTAALVTLVQAKAHLRIDAVASLRVAAEYVGTGNGVNSTFTLDHTPLVGSYEVWVNTAGTPILQVEATDYTLATATITFLTDHIPIDSAIVTASYDYAATEDTFESYNDDLLERLIEAATKKAEDYTGRAFVQREIVETHIGDNKQVLKLYKQPVVSVDSITVGGDALTSYTERLTIGRIYHLVVWGQDAEIVVTYNAGYSATRSGAQALVPDAMQAVLLIIANLFENRTDQVKSESVAGLGSVTYDIPSQAKELLNPLRVNII